jgi:hypothetical protein
MAEMTLGDLRKAVGFFLGWEGPDVWTDNQKSRITDCVNSGIQRYLHPLNPQTGAVHQWSFLARGHLTLSTVSGQNLYDLPADFGGFESRLVYDRGPQVELWSLKRLRQAQANNPETMGDPIAGACVSVYSEAVGQRWQLLFFPIPGRVISLTAEYSSIISTPSNDTDYLPGGGLHGEGYKESCLAVAEELENDEDGQHHQNFKELLLTNISQDAQFAPDTLGVMPPAVERSHRLVRPDIILTSD